MANESLGHMVLYLPELLRHTADFIDRELAGFQEVGVDDEEAFGYYSATRDDGGEAIFTAAVLEMALMGTFAQKVEGIGTLSSRMTSPESAAKMMVQYYKYLWGFCDPKALRAFGLDKASIDMDAVRLMGTGQFGGIVNPFPGRE